jgi:HEAT repeat protein
MKLLFLSAVLLLCSSPAAPAQVRDRGATSQSDLTILSNGWAALAAGRADAAVRAADDVLTRRPWDHRALQLKIDAQSSSSPNAALDTYERWLGARGPEDLGLLAPIAEGVLRQLASGGDPALKREAEEQLSAAAPGSSTGRDSGPSSVAALLAALKAPAGPTRAGAAASLGKLKAKEAEPALLEAMQDQDPFVRFSATVALARLGNAQGQQGVQEMLQSPVPDIRLMAAEAWDGNNGPWVAAITPLLTDLNGVTRLRAAALLAPVDPEAARRTLTAALDDPNPAVRSETARTMAQIARDGAADAATLRKLMRSEDPRTRLYSAGGILAAVRAPR